jgi:hypothetical protein
LYNTQKNLAFLPVCIVQPYIFSRLALSGRPAPLQGGWGRV